MYPMKKTLYLAALSALLLSATSCSENDLPESDSAEVVLSTRTGNETADFRLLVFDKSKGECLLNQSFGSGNKSVKLTNGTYRFVTLSGIEGFDLPADGTTDGISLSTPIALKAGSKCSPVQVCTPQTVSIPSTSVYIADLKPATCLLKPELINVPEGVTLALTNMYNSVSLTGKYAENEAVCSSYSLGSGENICLPTKGNAELQYTSGTGESTSVSGTLNLGMQLEAGYTYSFILQWHYGSLRLTSEIKKWDNKTTVNGDAEYPFPS